MKVLLTAHQFFPKYFSGTEVLARDAGLEMLARGHEVHVLTADPSAPGKSLDVSYEDYDYRGLKVHAIGLPKQRQLLQQIRDEYDNQLVAYHVRRYVRRLKPDVVHMFHLMLLSGSVIEVFEELDVPMVFTPTDFWAICVRTTLAKPSGELSTGPDDISSNCLECREIERKLPRDQLPDTSDKELFYRAIAERALSKSEDEHPTMEVVREMLARTEFLRGRFNRVDAILAPTGLMRQMLTANGIRQELVSVTPFGMDTARFRDAREYPSKNGGPRLGYIGTVHSRKGLHVLLEAFGKLPEDSDVTLRVCGDLSHFPPYVRKVYDLAGGDPRINFAGPFPNEKTPEELEKIDVLVVPSTWYENTPLVIYAAFAAGIPVVATNLGGMAEVVRHGENGLLFEPGDPEDLARQLKRLVDTPDLLVELGKNAGNVRTVEDSVDELLDLYERLREKKAREQEQARKASRSTEGWLWLNYEGIRENLTLRRFVAPFPPAELMRIVSTTTDELDFAAHGVHIYEALLEASPIPWRELPVILDFGCGSGRVARLFKDHEVDLHGVDVDSEHIDWIRSNLPYVKATVKVPGDPLPYPDDTFDAIYSISVFSHIDEDYHETQLAELARVAKPGALLFLSIHGERAFERAVEWSVGENSTKNMLRNVDEQLFQEAAAKFEKGEYAFVLQKELALTTDEYNYGITFIPASYIRRNWSEWFEVIEIRRGAIHDFQDIVVLRAKAEEPRSEPMSPGTSRD